MINTERCSGRSELMRKIRELDFVINEVALYLDVYPRCRKALEYYRRACAEREVAVNEYESKYGPLTFFENRDNCSWQWINSPWPWQYDAN